MQLEDFIEEAKKYQALGWAVQEQMDSLMDGEPAHENNPNANKMILDFLDDLSGIDVSDIYDLIGHIQDTKEDNDE